MNGKKNLSQGTSSGFLSLQDAKGLNAEQIGLRGNKAHPKVQVIARVLSASKEESTKSELAERLGLNENLMSNYIRNLCENNFLRESRIPRSKETIYQRTETGSRFLEAFVNLRRWVGEERSEGVKLNSKRATGSAGTISYEPCPNCVPHSSYSNLAPVTQHVSGECQICHTIVI